MIGYSFNIWFVKYL